MPRGVTHTEFPHGTTSGYWIHMKGSRRFGPPTPPCDACKKAQAAYKNKRYHERKRLRGAPELNHTTPAIGFQRRIEAMMRMGWTAYHIAEIAFPDHPKESGARLVYRIRGKERITWATALKIHKAYSQLQYRQGPSDKTARFASKHGYAAPGCWDDIDNPDERPQGVMKWRKAA